MENLNDLVQKSDLTVEKSEKHAAPHMVQRILGLLRSSPEKFKYRDLTDWPLPRHYWQTLCKTKDGDELHIGMDSEVNEMHISILISDNSLRPGTPAHNGKYAYRVDIFAGECAKKYEGTIGFATSKPSFIFSNINVEVIISDNWAETITDVNKMMDLLTDADFYPPVK